MWQFHQKLQLVCNEYNNISIHNPVAPQSTASSSILSRTTQLVGNDRHQPRITSQRHCHMIVLLPQPCLRASILAEELSPTACICYLNSGQTFDTVLQSHGNQDWSTGQHLTKTRHICNHSYPPCSSNLLLANSATSHKLCKGFRHDTAGAHPHWMNLLLNGSAHFGLLLIALKAALKKPATIMQPSVLKKRLRHSSF